MTGRDQGMPGTAGGPAAVPRDLRGAPDVPCHHRRQGRPPHQLRRRPAAPRRSRRRLGIWVREGGFFWMGEGKVCCLLFDVWVGKGYKRFVI